MKKLIIFLFVNLLILTGCQNKVQKNELVLGKEKFDELNNYNLQIEFNMISDTKNIKETSYGIIDARNKIKRFTIEGNKDFKEIYFDYNNNLVYHNDNNMWTTSSISDISFTIFDEGLLDIISKTDSVKKGNSYKIKLPFNKIYPFLDMCYDYLDKYKDSKTEIVINISIDKKTSNYSKIEIDLNNLFEKDSKITNCTYIFNFSKYNENDKIIIPNIENVSEPINTALIKTTENIAYSLRETVKLEYMSMLLEAQIDNDIIYNCTKDGCISAGKKLELSSPPSSGLIIIKPDGTLSFSGIVINGYSCDIPNNGEINCKK